MRVLQDNYKERVAVISLSKLLLSYLNSESLIKWLILLSDNPVSFSLQRRKIWETCSPQSRAVSTWFVFLLLGLTYSSKWFHAFHFELSIIWTTSRKQDFNLLICPLLYLDWENMLCFNSYLFLETTHMSFLGCFS